ncbi:hypothetical protein DD595_25860 [Enterobacter cloacae complex sp. 4DZ3-17B2]|nr:hypothetical protein DD595_25860 [Enterobacter cloacae complex sp. 4DZ3-17B2]
MAICIGEKDLTPVFANIQYIGVKDKHIFFIYNELEISYCAHYNAYEVVAVYDGCDIIDKEALISFIPYLIIKKNSSQFRLLRNML